MTLGFTEIDCNDYAWLALVNKYFAECAAYINTLENTQKSATDAVTSEIGAARSGAASLLAKIQDMDGVDANLLSMVQGLAAGVGPVLYDPAATYEKDKSIVVYDGGLYICIAVTPITGVAPPAVAAWKNMLGWQKTPTPTLAGPLTASEGTTQRVSLGSSYDATARYWPTVSGGTLSDLKQFPDDGGQYAGEWGWDWIMPTLDADAVHQFLIYATTDGYARSNEVTWSVTVHDEPVQEATMIWNDLASAFSEGVVVDGVVTAPARTAGQDSSRQILAVSPEILVVNGKLVFLAGTTETVLILATLVAAGDVIITDQGECIVASCAEDAESTTDKSQVLDIFGDGSCLSLYTFNDTLLDAGPYDRFNLPQEANCFVTGKFGKGYNVPSATPNIMTVGGTNMVPVDGARTVSFWAKFASASAISARIWNLQGGSDASTYTTDIGGIYSPAAGKVQAILNSGGFNSPQFDDPGDWFLMTFESSPDTGGKIYVNNTLLMEGIAHVEAKYAYRLYQATSTQGLVDQARIFNRVLTAGERAILLTETVPGYKATLAQPLPGVPTKAVKKEAVQLKVAAGITGQTFNEADFALTPASYTYALDGDDLKITGAEIALEDNPALKRLAMAVNGPDGMKFNRAKAHIKERS